MTKNNEERRIIATVELPVPEEIEELSDEEITQALEGQPTNFIVNSWGISGNCVNAKAKDK